jgi:transposase-like protein
LVPTAPIQSCTVLTTNSGPLSDRMCWGTRAERRGPRSAQKAAIIAESFEDGALVGHVARRHGLTPQQLFNWRRQARREQTDGCASPCHGTGHRGIERLDLARRRGCNGDCDHRRVEGGEVIGPSGAVRVLVATRPVDFRKGLKVWRRWFAT